ncbi:MAG: TolC family protein [Phycisphaerae bacterium]|nr:TolC family protein [Phycisphaerae bacterium]
MSGPRNARSVSARQSACRAPLAPITVVHWCRPQLLVFVTIALVSTIAGCRAVDHRRQADEIARDVIARKQIQALGRTEPFTIETPAETLRRRLMLDQNLPYYTGASLNSRNITPIDQWPDDDYLAEPNAADELVAHFDTSKPLVLTLTEALQIAAHESREYQTQKEQVFTAALRLDLERDEFRRTWTGILTGEYKANLEQEVTLDDKGHTDKQTVGGAEYGGVLGLSQKLKNGTTVSGQIGLDMVSLLTQERFYSRGIFADVTITVPLMRGSGEFIVTEPLTQADRNVIYALYNFERYKREFAVSVASEYLAVLRQLDSVTNAEDNYRRLISSTRRARRLADAGELPEIQVDQSRQDELRARNQWISAQQSYQRALDSFKMTLGLPTDALVELDRGELTSLADEMKALLSSTAPIAADQETPPADAPIVLIPPGRGTPGRYELDESEALGTALAHRLDLRVAVGEVYDTQRSVAVAADQLRADVTLLGSGAAGSQRALGSASQEDAILRPDEGSYSALLTVDLPFERTAERNTYRSTLIQFEQAVRAVQALEDQIKLDVRNGLSRLLEAREGMLIQAEAVKVAQRRVDSTNLFLEAGRAEIRDLLEAQDALVTAQNALTSALVSYRVNELSLQRDLGVLTVDERGLWQEYEPDTGTD